MPVRLASTNSMLQPGSGNDLRFEEGVVQLQQVQVQQVVAEQHSVALAAGEGLGLPADACCQRPALHPSHIKPVLAEQV